MFVTEGVAWLGFGATREAARGRGGQSALFATRLREARDQGCRWAITETGEETPEEPVNHSYRNMLRSRLPARLRPPELGPHPALTAMVPAPAHPSRARAAVRLSQSRASASWWRRSTGSMLSTKVW